MKSFREFVKERFLPWDDEVLNTVCEEKTLIDKIKSKIDLKLIFEAKTSDSDRLSNEEELDLLKKYKEDPESKEGQDALVKIIQNKKGYIENKANQLQNRPWLVGKRDDLISAGVEALMTAIERFDISKSKINSFNPFAIQSINGALNNFENPERTKSVGIGKQDEKGNFVKMDSVDTQISGSRGEWADKDMTLGDIIPDSSVKIPGSTKTEWKKMKYAAIRDFISQLPDRDQHIIEMYFGLNGQPTKTFEEIGQIFGISKAAVSQRIKNKLFPMLKEKMLNWMKEQPEPDVEE